jgi:hypothetical protein
MSTTKTPTANLAEVGTATPLAKVLQRAVEARHHARGRMISALLKHDVGKAQVARSEGQRAIVIARRSALEAARATVASERARLFGLNLPYARQDPAAEHHRESLTARALEGIASEQDALEAIGRALAARDHTNGFALAGGIAQHALAQGWDRAVDLWCQPMLGGAASRGGWDTARSIRAAEAVLADLAAKRWPSVLADVPTVEQVAAEVGVRLPE